MLQKETRKKLDNHKWEYIARHDSNPSQTFYRIRTKVADAFVDLGRLLRAEFPEEKEEQLFDVDKIRGFARALLKCPKQNQTKYLDQTRRSQTALILAEEGLRFLISQYKLLSKRTPFLAQTTINELERSIQICNDISDELQSRYLESKTQKEKTVHIFDWDRVPGRHEQRLQDFLVEQIELKLGPKSSDTHTSIKLFEPKKDESNRKLEWKINYSVSWPIPFSSYDDDYEGDDFTFIAIIKIESECRATLRIVEDYGDKTKEVHKQDLVVHKEKNKLHILNKE
ncbi:MAG: hypothetical protein DLM72_10085 [Candidatus Nitrosopolaris wilkensis]|nr:MAG: hypothetical protein DLM72_10085 [Candidatus Nitrosopolaris wilkensis]